MNRRRLSLAAALSLGAHVALVAAAVGSSLIAAWPTVPVDIEIAGMKMEDLADLPLGAPPAGADHAVTPAEAPVVAPPAETGPPRPKKPRPTPLPAAGVPEPPAAPTPPPRPQSVRSYGPEGSRVTALVRIDRLRGTPYTASVDALLMRLPDRRDLLEGTDLDLYRDIDALLVATPNPLDPAVTFLAVRHRLTDAALRAALERGAQAKGRVLKWRSERGRPFAERLGVPRSPGAPADDGRRQRDERLILLPAPRLAVVTPPAYRNVILRGRPAARPGHGAGGAGGAGPPAEPSAARGSGAGGAGSAGGTGSETSGNEHADWAALVRRIDAEDSILPADAVVMLSAEDVFGPARPRRASAATVAGTRGEVDDGATDRGDAAAAGGPRGTILGLPAPRLLTATIGIAPEPFSDLDVTFSVESEAARWEAEWPSLRQKLRTNPLVVLTGFSGLAGRITLTRAGPSLHVHVQATELEMVRLLQLLATQLPALSAGR